ncbi:prolipoprotein diacylglyceryl transferase [Erythrobacter arachoides]|uniref:Phosphatidylglycerol--prolipoprotein diacylglyceryl transferase n=1 Tax=Aurantiacibacter arachoides TaxID=1850444 RepID=A0A844ZYN2_9SPHN|nr:prolipoprotein diacylglyceryl transferase [Aurantiacibacter arachoides]MXO92046.1 prolipoprotein diacylglyceryl transferase [Aurantiacibacter arachoides]GGD60171.1 prolipoprotein diacylglyceryl transferase [Aurantiacibacter arachoides]
MLDLLALATATASEPIYWRDLGFTPGIELGFFTLRYYSLAYLIGLIFAYWHTSRMIKSPGAPMAQVHVDDLFFYCMLGVILGGRLGYLMFYEPSLWTDFSGDGFVTWRALRLWDGGMSFHGGLLGVVVAIAYVCWRNKLPFLRVADYISVSVGMGMLLGRLANFVNGELWGRPAGPDAPLAMIFPGDPLGLARHPSQLYQAVGEGLIVLVVMLSLFWLTRARFRTGLLVGVFTVLISLARFVVEFFRNPDQQLTWVVEDTGLSMGQWLTIPLIVLGLVVVVWALRRPAIASGAPVAATATGAGPA